MKTIRVDFSKRILKEICRQGEKSTAFLDFVLPADFAGADYVNAEFKKPSGKKETVELLDPASVVVPMTEELTCEAGRIGIQLAAYKLEGDEIIEIAKSPIVYGVIERSLGGSHHAGESVIERIIAFINEWRDKLAEMWAKKHWHDNKELLDSITPEVLAGEQADWNENDTTEKSYVKNRTHWYDPEETIVTPADKTGLDVSQADISFYFDLPENTIIAYWYRIGDAISSERIRNCSFTIRFTTDNEVSYDRHEEVMNYVIGDETRSFVETDNGEMIIYSNLPVVFNVINDGSSFSHYGVSALFERAGLYAVYVDQRLGGLPIEEVTDFTIPESYHPLNVDYLPNSAKDAIELKHTHTNKTVLDDFSELNGILQYDGHAVPQFPINNVEPTTLSDDYTVPWLKPNVWHRFGSADSPVRSISILALEPIDNAVAEEYVVEFWTGATAPSPVIFPLDVKWPDGSEPVWGANKHYQVSIVGNMGLYAGTDYGEEEEE